jgi:hypothetical protein
MCLLRVMTCSTPESVESTCPVARDEDHEVLECGWSRNSGGGIISSQLFEWEEVDPELGREGRRTGPQLLLITQYSEIRSVAL